MSENYENNNVERENESGVETEVVPESSTSNDTSQETMPQGNMSQESASQENSPYENNPYGNNAYGNNAYGNNVYGNNVYGNNVYGNNAYGSNNQNFNQPYQPYYGAENNQKGEGIAFGVTSLVLGILTIVLFCTCISWITGVLAIIFGIIQLVKYRQKGLAIGGIITASIGLLLTIILYTAAFAGMGSTSTYNDIYNEIYDDIYDDIYDGSYDYDYYFDDGDKNETLHLEL